MEQLKPLLKHKFWIIFGIALVLPIVGWFLATGQANERIDERITKISGTNVQNGSSAPNEQWIQKLTEINAREDQRLDEGAAYLWQQQKALMVWHPQLRSLVGNLSYRDKIPEQALNWYSSLYESEFDRIRKVVRPYDFETDQGVVNAPPAVLHIHPNYGAWVSNPGLLKSEEMWDAQEDIWLLEALLRAIDNTNRLANASSITEAYVRQIDRITLQGGSRSTGEGGTSTGGSSPGGAMDSDYAEMMDQYSGGPGGSGYGDDMGGGGGAAVNVSFDPAEEFGSDAIAAAEETTSTAGSTPSGMPSLSANLGGMGGGMGAGQQRRRYIDNEGLPFRTRGFYMELVIDHTKLPELLGELSSLPWPVEIVRVQQGEYASSGGSPGGGMTQSGGGLLGGGGGGNPFMRNQPMGPMGGGYRPPGGPFGGGQFGRRPMGSVGPMGPMGPMGTRSPMGRGPMGVEQKRRGEKYSTAMQDPVLARVAIAGLLTLFENPQNQDPGTGYGAAPESTTPAAPADPAATPPAAGPADPATPGVPATPTSPTDPAAPVDGAVAPPEAAEGVAPPDAAGPDATAPPAESAPPAAVPDAAPAATDEAVPVEDPAAVPANSTPPASPPDPSGTPETPADPGPPGN